MSQSNVENGCRLDHGGGHGRTKTSEENTILSEVKIKKLRQRKTAALTSLAKKEMLSGKMGAFSGFLSDSPDTQPPERATSPKRPRMLVPESKESTPVDFWSSLRLIMSDSASEESAILPQRSASSLPDKSTLVNYGSEEDSDLDMEENDNLMTIPPVSKVEKLNFSDEGDNGLDAVMYQGPPQLKQPQKVETVPEPIPTTEPEPATKLKPTTEPEPTNKPERISEYGPTTKFSFDWRLFPQNQIRPELRREPFSSINCGPTVNLASPYEAFIAVWDRQIMERIAIETNSYAQQVATKMLQEGTLTSNSRILRWQNTNADELYVFFGIILATGILIKSCLRDYWNKSEDVFFTPGFSASMKYDRYVLLNKFLHFNDNDGCNPEVMTRLEAKLFKIKPIIDHLNARFPQLYNMSQNLTIDQSLTMYQGSLNINQFIRHQAASVGIKTYELCECQTGYLWRFEVHTGESHPNSADEGPLSNFVPSLVLKLLKGLEQKGHTIWMDNFYNSPALARELKIRGFDCVGTLRTNRPFVPTELATLGKNDMAVGQLYGCTSQDVDIVIWRNKNLVALISTYHGLVSVRCGDIKPSIVLDYNLCMEGIDRKDQMLAMYRIERKRTQVWYKKFFKSLLNMSVLNSYILLKSQQQISHIDFRKNLVCELVSRHRPTPLVEPRVLGGHFPGQYEYTNRKDREERVRRVCKWCKKRTTTFCKACNVPLCVFTCMEPYHT